jgi:hypothetical protein
MFIFIHIYILSLCISINIFYEISNMYNMVIHIFYLTCFKGPKLHMYMNILVQGLKFSRFLLSSFLYTLFYCIKAFLKRILMCLFPMNELSITSKRISMHSTTQMLMHSNAQNSFWAKNDYICCRSKFRNIKHLNVGLLVVLL